MSPLFSEPSIRDSIVPLSVEQYDRMGAVGIIVEKTELIRGVILRKMNKSPLHSWMVTKLVEILSRSAMPNHSIRSEQPLALADSEPEPDISIVPGSNDDYRTSHPTSAVLVVEVAITSEALDREKIAIYAEASVTEYWLVLPEQRQVERFSEPANGSYQETHIYSFDETVELSSPISVEVNLRELT